MSHIDSQRSAAEIPLSTNIPTTKVPKGWTAEQFELCHRLFVDEAKSPTEISRQVAHSSHAVNGVARRNHWFEDRNARHGKRERAPRTPLEERLALGKDPLPAGHPRTWGTIMSGIQWTA